MEDYSKQLRENARQAQEKEARAKEEASRKLQSALNANAEVIRVALKGLTEQLPNKIKEAIAKKQIYLSPTTSARMPEAPKENLVISTKEMEQLVLGEVYKSAEYAALWNRCKEFNLKITKVSLRTWDRHLKTGTKSVYRGSSLGFGGDYYPEDVLTDFIDGYEITFFIYPA